jgi:hypothetical protein
MTSSGGGVFGVRELWAWSSMGAASAVTRVLSWGLVLSVILVSQGLLPGFSASPLSVLLAAGAAKCLSNDFPGSLLSGCESLGGSAGAPFLSGAPQIYAAWLLSVLPGLDVWAAVEMVAALAAACGLAGGYFLLRRCGSPWHLSLLLAGSYEWSLSIVGFANYPNTLTGFVLLPAYVFLGLILAERLRLGHWAQGLVGATALAILMVFTDGYSYMSGVLLLGGLGVWWGARQRDVRRRVLPSFVVAHVLAVTAYAVYVPGSAQSAPVGIGAFRFLGLDIVTTVRPSQEVWWAARLGLADNFSDLWGDGSNVGYNYLGISVLVLVFSALLLRHEQRDFARVLLLLGLLAFVLSLGPGLKVGSTTFPIEPAYDVPPSGVVATLPTQWLYEAVPGLTDMRATYRWFTVTRLVSIAIVGLAVAALWRRGRYAVAVVLPLVAVFETMPNLPLQVERRLDAEVHLEALRDEVLPEAQRLLVEDEKVLFLPSDNDFLINALAPFAGVSTFNIGIDKNYALARASWPESVTAAARGFGSPDTADFVAVLVEEGIDAVVVTHFSSHAAALRWPPPAEPGGFYQRVAAVLERDPRLRVEHGRWMTVVRGRPFVGP